MYSLTIVTSIKNLYPRRCRSTVFSLAKDSSMVGKCFHLAKRTVGLKVEKTVNDIQKGRQGLRLGSGIQFRARWLHRFALAEENLPLIFYAIDANNKFLHNFVTTCHTARFHSTTDVHDLYLHCQHCRFNPRERTPVPTAGLNVASTGIRNPDRPVTSVVAPHKNIL